MRSLSRALVVLAVLLIGVAYVRPLWHIALEAPQYPEGLGMYIWADKITGEKPQDLNSINGLNHYIGMKEIVPESIPELRLMPFLLGGLAALGVLTAATGSRKVLALWVVLFALLAVAGLADFWKWGYEYGHELDPTAAIKVPGMAYQPPVIGSKQLLNFRATSWPALGGLALMASVALGAVALLLDRRRRPAAG
ncbi:MAG TPA: hypothetical protein VLA95_07725 [Gemmatimonadales bacterium]|nr:hypothetical protein [Gemmatimonadales bacterium]